MTWIVCTLACVQAPPPPPPAAGACGRLYGSTRSAIEQMHAASTEPAPAFVPKPEWVERCVAAGLTVEQLRCADPRVEIADLGCADRLEPVRDRVIALREALIRRNP